MIDSDDAMPDASLREALVAACCELARNELTHGASGNVSVRAGERRFLVTPTGAAFASLEPDDMAVMDFDGRWFGERRPSSEWRFHRDILESRHEVGAVVHTHSRNATALACTGRGIPAFHYMVAAAGGSDIRCAPYFTFGTQELSEAAIIALDGRKACLLANHGCIALGADLRSAVALAGEVENLATQYCMALSLGDVRILDEGEMRRVIEKFRTYGTQAATDPDLVFGGQHPSSATLRKG